MLPLANFPLSAFIIESFVQGKSYGKLAEGVMTTKALKKLAEKHNVDMPIVSVLYDTLFEEKPFEKAMEELFGRSVKTEFY